MTLARSLIACGLLAIASAAPAQSTKYPERAVKIIVPLAVGSSGDQFTRYFAEQVTEKLGQPFVVENAPGANGIVGVNLLLRAPSDGYTVLQGTSAIISLNPITLKGLPYDAVKDLRPIAGLIRTAQIVVVPASSPIRSFTQLVETARKASAPLNSATYGPLYLLAQEWLGSLAGVRFNNIAYKGAAAAAADLAGGQVDMGVVDIAGILPLIKAEKVRVLAVSSEERVRELPDVPTIRESGFPDMVSYAWASLFVKSDTPDDVVQKLATAVTEVHASPKTRERIAASPGVQPMAFGPAEMRRFQLAEIDRLRKIADQAGIQAQ